MIQDPYKVLGLPNTATDDEVKAAYRKLAKRYHPDLHPGDKECERKMLEVNAAYDQIINHKNETGSSYGPSYGQSSGNAGGYETQDPFGGYGPFWGNPFGGGYQSYNANESEKIRSARIYIQSGAYSEALHVLESIGEKDRNAEWYYYSARANLGLGNRVKAREHAQKAVDMDGSNPLYQTLLDNINNPNRTYSTFGRGYNMPQMDVSKLCLSLCVANLLCNLCGGRGYMCCM